MDDGCDPAGVGDVVEWIGFEEDEVSDAAGLDGAVVVELVVELCGVEGGGLQGLKRGEACGYEALQFEVEADAGEDVDSGGRVGAGEERDARGVKLADEVELVGDEFFADGKWVGVEGFEDAFLGMGPLFGDPGVAGVGEVGIFGVVDGIDQPLTAFPKECGALPDVIFCNEVDDGCFAGWVVGFEEHAYGFFASEVFGFVG